MFNQILQIILFKINNFEFINKKIDGAVKKFELFLKFDFWSFHFIEEKKNNIKRLVWYSLIGACLCIGCTTKVNIVRTKVSVPLNKRPTQSFSSLYVKNSKTCVNTQKNWIELKDKSIKFVFFNILEIATHCCACECVCFQQQQKKREE